MSPPLDWKENVAPGEAARFERLGEQLRELQRRHAEAGKPSRALHAKALGGFLAELTILPDLPEHARAGLFASPRTFQACVRFSNGAGRRQADGKPDVRGVALKVLDVPGKKLIPGMEDETTQDFLLIRTPSTPFRDADEFVSLVVAAQNPLLLVPRVLGRFGFGAGFALLKRLQAGLAAPMSTLATTAWFSALPIKFGPYAVKYGLAPRAPAAPAPRGASPDHLGEDLARTLREGPVEYDFRVQFFVDETRTPIEDGSVEWREADAPFVTVARLSLPKQDAASERGRRVAERIEGLSFDPWHALAEHRPLGGMMRARNAAYRLSTQERGAAREPKGASFEG